MLGPSDLIEPLKFIATLVDEMEECNEICALVHRRMVVINDKLLAMEKQRTLPTDTVVRDYSALVTDFKAFLTKHKRQPWVYRIVVSRRVIGKVKSYQERINTLMLALDVIHIGAVADEHVVMKRFRAKQERFRVEQERVIRARLTDDAAVAKAVARVDQQFEALNVLMHELRKADRLSTATTTTALADEDDDGPDAAAANQRLLTTALDKVMRRSKVQVREVPMWFCAAQDVEYETDAFASGSFGAVHHGRMNDMDVVVKCLLVDTRGNAMATKQFRDEATLWFGFRHRHVLLMYSACDVSSPPFIVCELAANGNLFNFLSFEHNKPHTFRLLHQAALGLAYLHANRVVHGDLKGDNILVSADECAKIADFSFSYVRAMSASRYSVAQSTTAGGDDGGRRRAGAIRWRAPECLEGRSPTLASDVFSFGMCILEVVSQAVPWGYRVDDITVRCLVVAGKLPERPSNMSDRVWSLVTRMCSLEPGDRPRLAAVITELSDMAKDAELATRSASAMVDSTVSGVASMAIRDSDVTAGTASSVVSFDALSPVSVPTTLEQAITQDDVACATRMLPTTTSINEPVVSWDAPPLAIAAATGATKVTKILLARGADANALFSTASPKLQGLDVHKITKCTALHIAAQFGHIDVIEVLLCHGARIEEPDNDDRTPLYWSAVYGQVKSARVLLEHMANVHAKKSSNGTTALHYAVEHGHVGVIEELLRHGARIDEPDNNGNTSLIYSAWGGQTDCARVLLERKANVHAKRSCDGSTALHRAVALGHVGVIEELLRHGARVDEPDNDGRTPLFWSAYFGQVESARVLLEHKADAHKRRRRDGATTLHEAVALGHFGVIEELLRHGARANERDNDGATPLHWSAWNGQAECVCVLFEHKANVHAKKSNGVTALHQAVAKGHVGVIKELLRHGADVGEPDNNGYTPLYWAAWKGQAESARVLLAAGAEVTPRDVKTAKKNGHSELVRLLKSHAPSRLSSLFR